MTMVSNRIGCPSVRLAIAFACQLAGGFCAALRRGLRRVLRRQGRALDAAGRSGAAERRLLPALEEEEGKSTDASGSQKIECPEEKVAKTSVHAGANQTPSAQGKNAKSVWREGGRAQIGVEEWVMPAPSRLPSQACREFRGPETKSDLGGLKIEGKMGYTLNTLWFGGKVIGGRGDTYF